MNKNSYKVSGKSNGNGGGSFFSLVERGLKQISLFEDGIPAQYLPQVLFIVFLVMFYIGNNHFSERSIRNIEKLEVEVEELRADYTSLKAEYMFASKQSEVARKVKSIGLKESLVPPNKIIIEEGEY